MCASINNRLHAEYKNNTSKNIKMQIVQKYKLTSGDLATCRLVLPRNGTTKCIGIGKQPASMPLPSMMDKEMSPGYCFGPVPCVLFSASTLLVG